MTLAGFLMFPFAFMFGGAAAWPSAFKGALLYLFCGFGSAIFLYSRRVAARALAVVWHAVLVGYLFVGLFASARITPGNFSLLFFLVSSVPLLPGSHVHAIGVGRREKKSESCKV